MFDLLEELTDADQVWWLQNFGRDFSMKFNMVRSDLKNLSGAEVKEEVQFWKTWMIMRTSVEFVKVLEKM
jgi:hypothetical protein